MSLNWVERSEAAGVPFVPLPSEVVRYAQQERVSIKLVPVGQPKPETTVVRGHIYVTNQRIVVLTDHSLQPGGNDNFSLLFNEILSHKLDMPWFGSNKYVLRFHVHDGNGGLNYLYDWDCTIEFPYGGAIRFNEEFNALFGDFRNNSHNGAGFEPLPVYTE